MGITEYHAEAELIAADMYSLGWLRWVKLHCDWTIINQIDLSNIVKWKSEWCSQKEKW